MTRQSDLDAPEENSDASADPGAPARPDLDPDAPLLSQAPEVLDWIVGVCDRPGPRYTSYPTAAAFSDDHPDTFYPDAVRRSAELHGEPISAYVHIPFCEERCTYCGCHVIPTRRKEVAGAYVDHLLREIDLLADSYQGRRPVKVLHFGGGTPTYLTPDQIQQVVERLGDRFSFTPSPELSIEIDPRVTPLTDLGALRDIGFNRASLGVQDFDAKVQEAIGRRQTPEDTETSYSELRRLEYESINFDLVYGLPYQTATTMKDTFDEVIRLGPDRIAFYSYAHVPWMRKQQEKFEPDTIPLGATKLRLFLLAQQALLDTGYESVGMDHFALPDDELTVARREGRLGRNFMGYTTESALDIIGLGCSSIASLPGAYVQNERKLAPYYNAIDADKLPGERAVPRTEEDEVRRWVIHKVLCQFHVDAAAFESQFDEPLWDHFAAERPAVESLEENGLVRLVGDDVELTTVGSIFVRNVAMAFDAYLSAGSSGPRFSRTV